LHFPSITERKSQHGAGVMLPAQDCLDYNPYSSVGEVAVVRVEKQRLFEK